RHEDDVGPNEPCAVHRGGPVECLARELSATGQRIKCVLFEGDGSEFRRLGQRGHGHLLSQVIYSTHIMAVALGCTGRRNRVLPQSPCCPHAATYARARPCPPAALPRWPINLHPRR